MTQLTENTIEQSLIDQLVSQGYTYHNGTDISPTGDNPQRENFASVILENHFKASLKQLNPSLPASALTEAFQKVINLGTQDIMENNERFHTMLTNGVTVEFTKEGRTRGIIVTLLDVANPENNSFWVVNQLVVRENNNEKRFDVVIFVNGLPLVFIELKSASDEKATLRRAFTQIQNYKKAVPSVFYYNAICIISDGIDAATSSLSAPFSRYLTWKAPHKEKDAAMIEDANLFQAAEAHLVYGGMTELQTLTKYMLNKKTLVELIRYCTVFEQEEKKDEKTGLVSQVKVKKVAAYHQYYVVQKAVQQTLRATAQPSSNFSQGEKDAKYQGVSGLSQGEKDAYYYDEYGFSLEEKSINYRGNYNFSGLVEKARALRRNQTSVEKTLWEVLRNRQFLNLKFRRQHQIGDYIVDFYCNELKLVVELDGEYHFTEEQQKKDKKREAYLTSIGNKVLRFRNEEVDTNLESILQTIRGQVNPLSSVSPKGRETGSEGIGLSPSGRDGSEGYANRKIGVVWHTQGSGKSLSMVFYCGQIITHPQMGNPTIVMLTDRNDLDDQLFGTFGNCVGLLRQTPVQADSREHIKELLKVQGGGVIFTTIQKFAPTEGNVYQTLSERTNIVVVADEAHRSQYGFTGRVVETDEGSEIRYGNAKYLRDALPNASYIGFTGTPIEMEDKSTPAVFGNYIDVYDIKQAVDDGATVPISYESRLVKIKLDDRTAKSLDDEINSIADATEEQIENAKKRTTTIDAVVGHPERIRDIAKDIVMHFEARQKVFEGKAMIVGMTRNICVKLYSEIVAIRPDWHNDDLIKGVIKIIMTSSSDDPETFQPHHTTKQQRKELAVRMKDTTDELKLVIVRDMWLTGFDAPSLHTMYVDKKMQGHNLMQAIARVNRVYKDKPGGLIVDYIGIGQDLRNAMVTYLQSGGEGSPIVDIKEVIAGMQEKHEVVEQMFHGFDYKKYFKANTAQKLQILLAAQNFILANEKLKERFLKEITLLSKLFAMAIPSFAADNIKDEVAFFQAIKARINKFSGVGGGKSDYEVETAIKQIIDDALSSEGVIDIFEAAGIKAPSISILSDEFLLEVKNMPQKNVAFELLRKLLNDEVRIRKRINIPQGKKFSEMLEAVIKRYHNNQIDSAQVLAELTNIAKEMRLEDHKAGELGLSSEEYAFYSVLKENESTSFLDDDKMKELIHTIVDVIRKNATVDWDRRDDVRAKLRLTVRKILMRYGYPPDLARMQADRVLAQAESLAGVFSGEG